MALRTRPDTVDGMTAMAEETFQRPVGELLRDWRQRRRMSQLDLANIVDVSTRHLSFVETSRAKPSREMVLRLAEHLDVPLRDRNQLLLAAGYAPVYTEASLHSPQMLAIRDAVRRLLKAHEPYPAMVVDRWWNLVEANAGMQLMMNAVSPALREPPANVLRASVHPDGLAPMIRNLGEWRAHILGRLHRQLVATADPELQDLYDELRAYPCDQPEPLLELPGPGEVVVQLRLAYGEHELTFLSTVATFGTPLDITVSELVIESFFPADEQTADVLHGVTASGRSGGPAPRGSGSA
jgi:transcriptional regulator with XRE-family HTH domain